MVHSFIQRTIVLAVMLVTIATASQLFSPKAFAHEVEENQQIGALLHVDPNDEPRVNKHATITFTIKDMGHKFSSTNCKCALAIMAGETQIYQQAITGKGVELSTTFTFTQKAKYQLVLSGEPRQGNDFPAFTFTYPISVTDPTKLVATAQPQSSSQPVANKAGLLDNESLVVGSLLGVSIIAVLFFAFRKRIFH